MSLTARIAASINAPELFSDDLGSSSFTHLLQQSVSFTAGTGANQVDRAFSDTRTLAPSANEDLDLAGSLGGKLVGIGATVVFAEVAALMIVADAANTNNVVVTRPASNGVPIFLAAGDGITLGPGDFFMGVFKGATGKAVTAATGDLINIANSGAGTSVNYSILVLGRSA